MSDDILIAPLREPEIPELLALARDTWQHHYPAIISQAQIDYMLEQRYSEGLVRSQLGAEGIWWDVIRRDGELVGFAQYELADAGSMKLDKLYVRYALRGLGLGSTLLRHVENEARAKGRHRLFLQVNKNNQSAVGAYRKNGFEVAREIVVDIGGGFVMDDFVMEKKLAPLPQDRGRA